MTTDIAFNFKTPRLGGIYRIIMWVALLALTALILTYPVELDPNNGSQLESIGIFLNLPAFAGLFIGWICLLLVLLYTRTGSEEFIIWEKLGLVLVFIVVYLGFWTLITPLGRGDIVANLGHVRYLDQFGWDAATSNNLLTGFDFPGIYFAIWTITSAAGIDLLASTTVIMVTGHVLLALLLYIFFIKTLKNAHLAAISVILAVVSNIIITGLYSFHALLAIPFMVSILVLLNRKESALFASRKDIVLMVLLFVVATITHFVTSMAILFIMMGIWVTHRVRRNRIAGPLTTFSPWLFVIMVGFSLGYQVLWAVRTMRMLVSFLPGLIDDIITGELFLTMRLLFAANVTSKVPIWASITRTFWLGFIYVYGAFLAVAKVFWPRKSPAVEVKEMGAIFGIGVMALLAMLLAPQGNQFHRFIMYGSIVAVPFVVRVFFKTGERWRRAVLLFLISICFVLMLPTFLAHNGSVVTSAFLTHEARAGEYLEEAYYPNTSQLTTFSVSIESGAKLTYYYLPESPTKSPPLYTTMRNEEGQFGYVSALRDNFLDWDDTAQYTLPNYGGSAVYISSELMKLPYYHLFEVASDDPRWGQLEQDLIDLSLRVYDSGNIRLYVPR